MNKTPENEAPPYTPPMREIFRGDSYRTPEDTPRYLLDKIFFWTRWSFYLRFIKVVLRSKYLAGKNRFDRQALAQGALDILKAIEGCGGKITIQGLDNIRGVEGPAVFIANHMSALEAVVIPCMIAPIKPVSFILKEKLVKGAIFGPIARALDPIAVTRKDPRQDLASVLTQGPQKIAQGRSLVVFPQGASRARSSVFNPAAFNSLGTKLAARAGVPIIPVAVKTDFWGNGKILHDFGAVRRAEPTRFEFGPPIHITGKGRQEQEAVLGFIMDRLKTWNVPIKENA